MRNLGRVLIWRHNITDGGVGGQSKIRDMWGVTWAGLRFIGGEIGGSKPYIRF